MLGEFFEKIRLGRGWKTRAKFRHVKAKITKSPPAWTSDEVKSQIQGLPIGSEPVSLTRLPHDRGKPRVLYFIVSYPTFSETYMHEEIKALSDSFDIKIITYRKSGRPRSSAFDHTLVEYRSPCVQYGPFEKVNLDFSDKAQQMFLAKVDKIIRDFKPDILHGHYLGMGYLMAQFAERHQLPFTVRTHSMDVLNEPAAKLDAYCAALNSRWCRKVLAFPHSVQRLTDHGLNPDKLDPCWPVIALESFVPKASLGEAKRVICLGPTVAKKAQHHFVDLADKMRGSNLEFDLYGYGPEIVKVLEYNKEKGSPVTLKYADPEDMPEIWPHYDWLVYPSDPSINKVGLPCGVAEAMAVGIGVCWQELPGRREEQLEFLGGAGFLYSSIDEVPNIISNEYPAEKRVAGFESVKRFDINAHKHLLSDVWKAAVPDDDRRTILAAKGGTDRAEPEQAEPS